MVLFAIRVRKVTKASIFSTATASATAGFKKQREETEKGCKGQSPSTCYSLLHFWGQSTSTCSLLHMKKTETVSGVAMLEAFGFSAKKQR